MIRTFDLIIIGGLMCCGCTKQPETDRFQLGLTPAIGRANSMRSLIDSLQHQLETEGLSGVQSELIALDELIEDFAAEELEAGEQAVYKKILPKLEEFVELVNSGGAKRTALSELLREMETLSTSLPKATPISPVTS